jgi:mono/diheme cytochrome c family protein
MQHRHFYYGLLLTASLFLCLACAEVSAADQQTLERGRYLFVIGLCNDCHTAHYLEQNGQTAESDWQTGSPVGFQGPWGTTYAANLRLVLNTMSAEQWLAYARMERRPPMPWFNLKQTTDEDLTAMYHYVRSLGPAGEPAPPYAAPGQAVTTPYYDFVPKNLPQQAQLKH